MKRHVKFIQECQRVGEVVVVYLQSDANSANILTKPVSTKVFETLRDVILNVRRTAVNLHAIVASKMPF